MLRVLFSILVMCLCLITGAVHAQDASETLESTTNATMSQIVQEAAQNGMTVIVLDANGNAVSTNTPDDAVVVDDHTANRKTAVMRAQSQIDDFKSVLAERLDALPAAVNEVLFILRASSPDGTIFAFFEAFLWTSLFLFVGYIFSGQVYGRRIAARFVVPLIKEDPQGYSEKLPFLVVRFFAGVIGVAVAVAVGMLVAGLVKGPADDSAIRFTVSTIIAAYVLSMLVALTWRMILSPYLPQYRIPSLSTKDARRLHRWVCALGAMDICTMLFGEWLKELGLNYDVYALMTLALSTVFALANVAMVLINRIAISRAIRNGRDADDVTFATRWASILWAPAFIVYVGYGWAEQAFDLVLGQDTSIPLIAGAYIIFTSVIVVYATINFAIERYFQRYRNIQEMNDTAEALRDEIEDDGIISEEQEEELAEIEDFLDHRKINTFEELARRVSGILALVAGLYATIRIFGAQDLMAATNRYERFLDVVVILFIGYIVFHVFRIWIDTKIRDEQGDEGEEAELGDEGGANSASRLATLLPLFRSIILIVIIVTIALIALLEMGVNVSPLFAGAGVVGLAVGFGAQSLVRDVFSGAFFLFDDAFRKGEYIDIGSVKGTVEKISVRSFQLRHHLGPLHTIPFGEIQFLTNYSRDWVIMKLKLRVTYDTDVERVRKLIKKLGLELLDDPVIGHNFIQPLKSQGVVEMQDSAMIIRVKFMTKPGDQWLVRKKVYQDIRDLFEREGIHFAHREVTVRIADGKSEEELTPKQREAVAGAVEAAIDEDGLLDDGDGGDNR